MSFPPRRIPRQHTQPTPPLPLREDPAVIGQLYHACEEELCAIVICLHAGVALESLQPVSALCTSLATDGIEHYKMLCRLLHELGVPFRLQSRISCMPQFCADNPYNAAADTLTNLLNREEERLAAYRRACDRAKEHSTRHALSILSEEMEGRCATLRSLLVRITRS